MCAILGIFHLLLLTNYLYFFYLLLTTNYPRVYQLSHIQFSVSEGQETRSGFIGEGCSVAQGPLQTTVQVWAGSAVIASLRGGRGSSSKVHVMAVGRPPVLAGCLLETSVSCHMGLFIGQLIMWQLASLKPPNHRD